MSQNTTKSILRDEEWRPIRGYEGLYEISNLGRVRSLARFPSRKGKGFYFHDERIMSPCVNTKGYLQVGLRREGERARLKMIHKLVLEHFLPNPENKPQGNHKNGIKSDCRLLNLEWCTQSENLIHAYRTKLRIRMRGQLNPNFKHGRYGKKETA